MAKHGRALVLHPDQQKAQTLVDWLKSGKFEAIAVAEEMETIACFETMDPEVVILPRKTEVLPHQVLAGAFHQLNQDVRIWIYDDRAEHVMEDEAFQQEMSEIGINGLLSLPLQTEDLGFLMHTPKPESEVQAAAVDETETISSYVDEIVDWSTQSRMVLKGHELGMRKSFEHYGDLIIEGDLKDMEWLQVKGRLELHGNLINSHVRCDGNVWIEGGIVDCREIGLFTRANLNVHYIENSVVVCGSTLMFEKHCTDAIINVVERMIGRSGRSHISGGHIRVGQHLQVAQLGNQQATETAIELAPRLFYSKWQEHRHHLFQVASAHFASKAESVGLDRERFLREFEDPDFYRKTADLVIWELVHPGVSLHIGKAFEYVSEERKGRWRLFFDNRPEPGLKWENKAH